MTINAVGGLNSAFQSGVEGFQRASNGVSEAASNIASRTASEAARDGNAPVAGPNTSLTDDLIALNVNEIAAQASAKVIQTANDTIGTLIDETV